MAGSETPNTQMQGTLSERELQIVELVAAGLTNQEISDELEISKRTVDNHISNILTKTSTESGRVSALGVAMGQSLYQ